MTGCRDRVTILGLPGWKFFLPGVFLWVLFASSAAQSATLNDTFAISPGANDEFVLTGNLREYWGLDVGGLDVNTIVVKISAQPNNEVHAVDYTLVKVSSLLAFQNDTAIITPVTSGIDGLTALLLAGMEYVLSVECSTCKNARTSINNLSAVPLPAAAWLFGSALIGFIMMSNRRSV